MTAVATVPHNKSSRSKIFSTKINQQQTSANCLRPETEFNNKCQSSPEAINEKSFVISEDETTKNQTAQNEGHAT
jgi:hypothetical protein